MESELTSESFWNDYTEENLEMEKVKKRVEKKSRYLSRSLSYTLASEIMILNTLSVNEPPKVKRKLNAELRKVWSNSLKRVKFAKNYSFSPFSSSK